MNFTIQASREEVERRLGTLASESNKIIARAANRTATTGKKVLRQEVAKRYEIKAGDVDRIATVKRATSAKPFATLSYRAAHNNLYRFGSHGRSVVKPGYPIRSSNPYDPDPPFISAHVKKDNSGQPLSRGSRKPFVQIMPNGYVGLFRRADSNPRSELKGVAGPSIPQAMKNEEVLARFQREAGETMRKRLEAEISYALRR